MIHRTHHRAVPLICMVVAALMYMSLSSGCLRKWREKRAQEAAEREAEAQASGSSVAGPAGLGPQPQERVGGQDPDEAERADAGPVVPEPFRGVVGLLDGGEPGLEVAVWTCDDSGAGASRVLAVHADRPVPIDSAVRARWQARGLRFVAVPMSEIDSLASSTRAISPVQRQRFGQLTAWSAVVRGPVIPSGSSGPIGPLPSGKPRLIARAWVEPDLSAGVLRRVVRIELGVQVEIGRLASLLENADSLGTISDDGELLDGLLTSFVADGENAIVLLGESPLMDWGVLSDSSALVDEGATQAPSDPLGPSEPVRRSVGERMLTAEGSPPRNGRPGAPPRKVLIVLIPRLGMSGSGSPASDSGDASVNDQTPGG